MKVLYWNVSGIGNIDTQLHLSRMIHSHKPDFLFLVEPKVHYDNVPAWL